MNTESIRFKELAAMCATAGLKLTTEGAYFLVHAGPRSGIKTRHLVEAYSWVRGFTAAKHSK